MKEKHMIVSEAIEKMIAFYKGSIHDIDHFIKVWSYAKTIGELEGLDAHTQEVLELAAVIHDIACPLLPREIRQSARKASGAGESPAGGRILRWAARLKGGCGAYIVARGAPSHLYGCGRA